MAAAAGLDLQLSFSSCLLAALVPAAAWEPHQQQRLLDLLVVAVGPGSGLEMWAAAAHQQEEESHSHAAAECCCWDWALIVPSAGTVVADDHQQIAVAAGG